MAGVGNPPQTDGGQRMNDDTLLYRQVHPNFIDRGEATSLTFLPSRRHQYLLSVYDGDQIDPESSWNHYHSKFGLASAGVLGVSVAECNDLQLPARPDPAPFPEHAVIDFNGLSNSKRERKADSLKAAANKRGWLFRA